MASIFNPPKPKPAPPPVETTDTAVTDLQKEEARKLRRRQGRLATIATGPLGVEDQAPVRRKTLLGE